MREIIRKDIIKILSGVIDILEQKEEKDYLEIKELSNHTIHNSSIFQDDDSISVAILTYAIAKLVDRGMGDKEYDMIFSKLVLAKERLVALDKKMFREIVKEIFSIMSKVDEKLHLYVSDVITQAKMKKAGKIYQHGLSLGVVSELLGMSVWELTQYLGQTAVVSDEYNPKDIRKRLQFARKLFNV